jgi:hypothetical protein
VSSTTSVGPSRRKAEIATTLSFVTIEVAILFGRSQALRDAVTIASRESFGYY